MGDCKFKTSFLAWFRIVGGKFSSGRWRDIKLSSGMHWINVHVGGEKKVAQVAVPPAGYSIVCGEFSDLLPVVPFQLQGRISAFGTSVDLDLECEAQLSYHVAVFADEDCPEPRCLVGKL